MKDMPKYLIKQYLDILFESELNDSNPHTLHAILSAFLSDESQLIIHALNASSLVTQLQTLLADDQAQYTLCLLRRGGNEDEVTATEVHNEIRKIIANKIKEMEDIILPYQELKDKYLALLIQFPIKSFSDCSSLENLFESIKSKTPEVRTLFYQDLVKRLTLLDDSLLQQSDEAPSVYVTRVEEKIISTLMDYNTKKLVNENELLERSREHKEAHERRRNEYNNFLNRFTAIYDKYMVTNNSFTEKDKIKFVEGLLSNDSAGKAMVNVSSVKSDQVKKEYQSDFEDMKNFVSKSSAYNELFELSDQYNSMKKAHAAAVSMERLSYPSSQSILKSTNTGAVTAWLILLRTNQWRKAREAFKKPPRGVSIDTQDEFGNTALFYALRFGDVLLAKSLLEDYKANPTALCIQRMKQDLPDPYKSILGPAPDWDVLINFKINADIQAFLSNKNFSLGELCAYYPAETQARITFDQRLNSVKSNYRYTIIPAFFAKIAKLRVIGLALTPALQAEFDSLKDIAARLELAEGIYYDSNISFFHAQCEKEAQNLCRMIRAQENCTRDSEACWLSYGKMLGAENEVQTAINELKTPKVAQVSTQVPVIFTAQGPSSSSPRTPAQRTPAQELFATLESAVAPELERIEQKIWTNLGGPNKTKFDRMSLAMTALETAAKDKANDLNFPKTLDGFMNYNITIVYKNERIVTTLEQELNRGRIFNVVESTALANVRETIKKK